MPTSITLATDLESTPWSRPTPSVDLLHVYLRTDSCEKLKIPTPSPKALNPAAGAKLGANYQLRRPPVTDQLHFDSLQQPHRSATTQRQPSRDACCLPVLSKLETGPVDYLYPAFVADDMDLL